jgi:3D-(3,5/4)-trihydroxycyclohexane-1,2-dione acylhydrolase (decyclizing)
MRLTVAQALVKFVANQYSERDGVEQRLIPGTFGIFGHGNVAGVGQALLEVADSGEMPYHLARNEQGMVHAAVGFSRMRNRLQALACTASIGPGSTNMLTGAALATTNRIPVLLLPSDVFATRVASPVLQELEQPYGYDVSVNDAFRPLSKFFDRVWRPEQLPAALLGAMRVLTDPAETGAVTIALPQDVQAEAYDYPAALFEPRIWTIARPRADRDRLLEAAALIRASTRPLIIAGGGVLYSEATDALRRFVDATGIAVGETQAGKGSLPDPHPLSLGGVGATGTLPANVLAREADLVIVVGSRLSDFTTASKTAFQRDAVRFIAINVAEIDTGKHAALPLVGDARSVLEELLPAVSGYRVGAEYTEAIAASQNEWRAEVDRICDSRQSSDVSPQSPSPQFPVPKSVKQAQIIGVLQETLGPTDVIVCAAGSLPGDLHKLWRARDPKGYHMEYGYSCMGYEIAGGLGVKMAAPDRRVYVLVGDGSYLMMAQEIVTAVQERVPITIVLLNNDGFASIGGLSESIGSGGFGTRYRERNPETGELDGDLLAINLAANAESLGAKVWHANSIAAFRTTLAAAAGHSGVGVIVVPVDRESRVGGYESWWDVPIAEVSIDPEVRKARAAYDEARRKERDFL